MVTSTRLKILALVLFLLVCFPGEPQARLSGANFLKDVFSEVGANSLTIHLEFARPGPGHTAPVFSKNSVQIDFPHTAVQPAKRYFYTGDSWIPQVFVSQYNRDTVRVQFILGQKLPHLSEHFHLGKQGRFLEIRVNKGEADDLGQLLARAAENLQQDENSESGPIEADPKSEKRVNVKDPLSAGGNPIVAETLTDPAPQPKPLLGARVSTVPPAGLEPPSRTGSGKPLDPLPTTMKMLTGFSLVLGLMLLLFYLFKKFVLKNTVFGGSDKLVRVLGTGFLGPKKNIVLVEVAGEVLVLGIANDNISLLANIREKEKIEKIMSARREGGNGTWWNSQRKHGESPKSPTPPSSQPRETFINVLRKITLPPQPKEKSVKHVTRQIRRNLGNLRTL
ncbi:MAG: flagellar biosynthetic protein FliO [Nitrospinaceae bacterium]